MIETMIVIAVVGVVLVLAGRSAYRTLAGKKKGQCSGCSSCGACGSVEKTE